MQQKLADYSLDASHEHGGPKAVGFRLILGITLDDLDYLAHSIEVGILSAPVDSVRLNLPHGVNCSVVIPVRGLHEKACGSST